MLSIFTTTFNLVVPLFAVVFFGPVLLIALAVFLVILLIRHLRSRGAKAPRPVNRYLK